MKGTIKLKKEVQMSKFDKITELIVDQQRAEASGTTSAITGQRAW
jgi:hypothetical protein